MFLRNLLDGVSYVNRNLPKPLKPVSKLPISKLHGNYGAHILAISGHGVDKCEHAPEDVKDICRRLHVKADPMYGKKAIDDAVGDLGDAAQDVSNVAASMSNVCGSSSTCNEAVSANKRQRVSKGSHSQGKLGAACNCTLES